MTKEQILAKRIIRFAEDEAGIMTDEAIKRNVYAAMQQYADQETTSLQSQLSEKESRIKQLEDALDYIGELTNSGGIAAVRLGLIEKEVDKQLNKQP